MTRQGLCVISYRILASFNDQVPNSFGLMVSSGCVCSSKMKTSTSLPTVSSVIRPSELGGTRPEKEIRAFLGASCAANPSLLRNSNVTF